MYLCNVWLLCQDCSKSKIDCRPSIFQALAAFCSIKLWCVRFYLINLLIEYCFYTFGLCWIRKKRILPIEIAQNRNAEKKMSDNEVDYRWWVDKSNIFTLIRGPIVESGWFLLFASFFCLYFHHDLYLPVLSRKKNKKSSDQKMWAYPSVKKHRSNWRKYPFLWTDCVNTVQLMFHSEAQK